MIYIFYDTTGAIKWNSFIPDDTAVVVPPGLGVLPLPEDKNIEDLHGASIDVTATPPRFIPAA